MLRGKFAEDLPDNSPGLIISVWFADSYIHQRTIKRPPLGAGGFNAMQQVAHCAYPNNYLIAGKFTLMMRSQYCRSFS